ncbi:MAG: alpha/beta hydrolase fold protein [Solirubrobacterales bacterium]|nr:alpha/beta hydrolase fold protein [Solirubrobacterales bacterium]
MDVRSNSVDWLEFERDGVGLACRDFGGNGPAVLLLHGLAGHAEEWAHTAAGLINRHRVLALDARGHGRSARQPDDVSRRAHRLDVARVIEGLGLGPVALVGQSLGGVTALQVATHHPDLVRGLVMVEASPAGGGPGADAAAAELGAKLRQWPVPFPSFESAHAFFAERFGSSLAVDAWVAGLERRAAGLYPRFDVRVMEETLREAASAAYWEEWDSLAVPVMVIRATNGIVDREIAREMIERLRTAQLVELPGAHDVHLDSPDRWREALVGFMATLDDLR